MTTWNNGLSAPKNASDPATFTLSFSTAIAVTNAVSASSATVAAPNTRSPAYTVPNNIPRIISVTSTTHTGSYIITSPIVVTGTDINGNVVTDNLTLTQVNGGETIKGVVPMVTVTSIAEPAMTDTSGAFSYGISHIFLPRECRSIRIGSVSGGTNLVVGYGTIAGAAAIVDTIPACVAGEKLPVAAKFIYDTSTVSSLSLLF